MSKEVTDKEQELPEFTLKNVAMDVVEGAKALTFDPHYKTIVGPCLMFLSSIATKVIINKVPYTEIDFKTYMQQIEIINDGELDYSMVSGDTGPIVYPAGFVQLYQFIYWLTESGTSIVTAQALFGYLFTGSLVMTMLTYYGMPPWTLVLLMCSKRLMSIYVLRLFNDCFTTISMIGVTIILQQTAYYSEYLSDNMIWIATCIAADLFSIAISIKMNALLYLPGFIIVIYFLNKENVQKSLMTLAVIPLIQILVGWKFLLPFFNDDTAKYIRWTYINQAFKFDRKFLYEWTVNWRFVPEDVFLSDQFSNGLLIGHLTVLLVFIFSRFLSPQVTGKSITQLFADMFKFTNTVSKNNLIINKETGPKLIMLILSTTNLIGILFARSLHYQFLSWYFWQLPFMLTISNRYLAIPLLFIHEYCWNTYPSTPLSSGLLVAILAFTLFSTWANTKHWRN